MSDELIDSLVVSGDEAAIASRLTELLDELLVMPIVVTDPASELERLMEIIGKL